MLLTNFSRDIGMRIEQRTRRPSITRSIGTAIDLILTIIKLIEDRMNADNDILRVGVQSILLVEDSVKYYSTYLPTIYKLVAEPRIREGGAQRAAACAAQARPAEDPAATSTRRRSNCMNATRTTCWG